MSFVDIPNQPNRPIERDAWWTWWFEIMSNGTLTASALTDFDVQMSTGSDQSLSGYGGTKIAEITIDVISAYPNAAIFLFADCTIDTSSSSTYFAIEIKRGSTQVKYVDWYEAYPKLHQARLFAGDSPGVGTYTYELWVYNYYDFVSFDARNPTIMAIRFGDTI